MFLGFVPPLGSRCQVISAERPKSWYQLDALWFYVAVTTRERECLDLVNLL